MKILQKKIPQHITINTITVALEGASDEEKKQFYKKRLMHAYVKAFSIVKNQEVVELYIKQLQSILFSKELKEADFSNQCLLTLLNMLYDPRLSIMKQTGSLERFLKLIESNLPQGLSNKIAFGRIKDSFSEDVMKFKPIYDSVYKVIKDNEISRSPKIFDAIFEVSKQLRLVSGNYDVIDKVKYIRAINSLLEKLSSLSVTEKEDKMYGILNELGLLNPNLNKYNDEIKLSEPLLNYAKTQF